MYLHTNVYLVYRISKKQTNHANSGRINGIWQQQQQSSEMQEKQLIRNSARMKENEIHTYIHTQIVSNAHHRFINLALRSCWPPIIPRWYSSAQLNSNKVHQLVLRHAITTGIDIHCERSQSDSDYSSNPAGTTFLSTVYLYSIRKLTECQLSVIRHQHQPVEVLVVNTWKRF